jgi:hypothetical protein
MCFLCGLRHATIKRLCVLCVVRADGIKANTRMGLHFSDKRQTRPLVREGAPPEPDRTVKINTYLIMGLDTLTFSRTVTLILTLDFTSLGFRSSKGTVVWPEEELEDLV